MPIPAAPPSAFRTLFRGRRLLLVVGVAGLVGHQVAEALVPVLIGIVIDRAIEPNDPVALAWSLAALAALFLGLLLAWRMGELATVRATETGGLDLRRAVVGRLLAPRGFAKRRTPGDLLAVASGDVDRVTGMFWLVGGSVAELAAVVTVAVSLFVISPLLGVIVLVATPVLVVALHFATAPLERRSHAEQEAAATASAVASDLLTGLRTVKGLHAEEAAVARFELANAASLRASRRAITAKGSYSIVSMSASGLLLAGIAWVGGAQAIDGTISVGELVAVLGLAQFLYWPVSGLAFISAEFVAKRASAHRVDDVLRAAAADAATDARTDASAPTDSTAADLDGGAPVLVLDAVRGDLLPPVSVEVARGALVGVLLDDDEAARELSELLAGLRPPRSGRVLVDGRELSGPLAPESAAEPPMLSVPRHPVLFSGTVRSNLELAAPVSADALERATWAAVLDDVLDASPERLDRGVGERGLTLSGGQRQRVSLARGLARDPRVLVLHDPTSAVDSVTEARIVERLRGARTGATLVIAPSPALQRVCDAVVRVQTAEVSA
ncbi:ABC transporter ATP-binding protein [Agromyces sp. LHK192]|uniref:ABC transporter transmembrane domain-containing protein n=1 Tax=Agromyces sp. LHK192 TaxID=2498704 RepID=UPI000FDA7C67|nr:ABC transporter ATP-binding protein [Agromyces sp. LHK192]